MSRMAALVFFAAAAASVPNPPSGSDITAEQAMANYRAKVHDGISGPVQPAPCPEQGDSDQILVCKHSDHSARLPMPEDRFAPGEVVHHIGEPPRGDPGPPRVPSKFGETMMKGFKLLKSVVTGEDPTD
jgi:hypothetical protein